MTNSELMMLISASAGVAASLYAQYLYWFNLHLKRKQSDAT